MGKRSSKGKTIGATPRVIKKLIVLFLTIFTMDVTFANPEGGVVTSGDATIIQSPGNTQINQTSDKAIIEWRSFNIGANEKTQFNQPSSSSVTLNRIDPSQGVSQIFGQLSANGRVILVNQAGIYFGPTARVDVASVIASTRGITDQNFLAGKYIFDQVSNHNGTVINQGTIIAAQHGLVALIGANVSNEGYIQANGGRVVLASGNKFTVDLAGDGLLHFSVDEGSSQSGVDQNGNAMRDGVKNTGTIIADGGKILITAKAAQGIVDNAINMQGVAIARSVSTDEKGEIILSSEAEGNVVVASNLDASGKTAGLSGGTVKVLGSYIKLNSPTQIDVSGDLSGGEILIGGNYKGQGPERNALTTTVDAGVTLNANALTTGNGGKIIVWSDGATRFAGNATAQGGAISGDGGFVETSGKYLNVLGATVNTLAAAGKTGIWLLDPTNIYIALNQSNATAAGMVGTDTSANTESGGTFQASGAVDDSLLTTGSLETALASSNIIVTTSNGAGGGAGNITVVDPITWTSSNSLSLVADNNIIINAAITGTNGSLNLTAVDAAQSITTGSAGTIDVANFNLLQGRWYQVGTLPSFNVSNNFQIKSGVINPTNVEFLRASGGDGTGGNPYVLQDIYGVEGMGSSNNLLSSSFILGGNIDASSTINWNSGVGFVPIGGTTFFVGSLDGAGYTIDGLYLNLGSTYLNAEAGMFGDSAGTISNIGLTNVNITIVETDYNYNHNVGALIGTMQGGSVTNSYATGTITSTDNCPTGCLTIGGLIGLSQSGGSISNSYSAVNINATMNNTSGFSIVGGFIGTNNSSGSIANSYNTGSVVATGVGAGTRYAGGFAGFNVGGSVVISNSYNTGYLSTSGITSAGGFVGRNTAVLSNNYWDTGTSGTSTGVGEGSTSGATGGTFATLSSQATFSGWTFDASNWGIIEGQSYPYLRGIYIATPRAISGTSNLSANQTITIAANGTNLSGTTRTGANGFYYFLQPNTAIADGAALLIYSTTGTSANAITLAPSSTGSLTGVTLTGNTVTVGDSSNPTLSNSTLDTAKGVLSSGILYSLAGNDLTVDPGIGFSTNSSTTYSLNGNLTASGGITFNGALALAADAILDAGSAVINLATVNNPFALTLTTSGVITLNGIIGGSSALSGLTTNAATTINTTGITATGDLIFNNPITLTSNVTIASTSAGNIIFGSTIDGAFSLTLNTNGNISLPSDIGSVTPLSSIAITAANKTSIDASTITTTGSQTYINADILTAGRTFSITGIGDLTFSGNVLRNSFIASSSNAANTFSIQNSNAQTWNLTGTNSGTVNNIGGSDATFSGFGNLTGGSGNNTFIIADGATATLLTGGSGTTNTLQYNYASPLTLTMSSQYAGSVAGGGTINSYNNFDTVSGVATLTTANKTNNVYITGGGSGYVGDPFNFSGVSSIVGQGTTNIIFNTSATYTSGPSGGSATANVGGTSMSFSGISSFSGNASTETTTSSTVNQSTVNALVSQITLAGYTSITTQSQPQSQSSSSSSTTSSSGTTSSSNSSSDSDSSTTTNSNQLTSPITIVSNNTAEINQNQQQADVQQQESQSFSGGCGATAAH